MHPLCCIALFICPLAGTLVSVWGCLILSASASTIFAVYLRPRQGSIGLIYHVVFQVQRSAFAPWRCLGRSQTSLSDCSLYLGNSTNSRPKSTGCGVCDDCLESDARAPRQMPIHVNPHDTIRPPLCESSSARLSPILWDMRLDGDEDKESTMLWWSRRIMGPPEGVLKVA